MKYIVIGTKSEHDNEDERVVVNMNENTKSHKELGKTIDMLVRSGYQEVVVMNLQKEKKGKINREEYAGI